MRGNPRHLDEDLSALAVTLSAPALQAFSADLSKIVMRGEYLRKELLVMSGREAPITSGEM